METRSFLGGAFRAVVVIAIVIGVVALAGAAYGLGVNATLNPQTVVQPGQPVVVAPYGYPYGHGGFGFFGIFFWIIGFFLIIGLLRAAFGRGHRRGWGGDWGGGRGKWGHYDGRFGGPGGPDFGGPEDRIAEWHRELHRREEGGTGGGATTGSGTTTGTTTSGSQSSGA
jgi:hypothetical protein